jgi:hypothetical protein
MSDAELQTARHGNNRSERLCQGGGETRQCLFYSPRHWGELRVLGGEIALKQAKI